MKTFTDENGAAWVASAREEQTPRHHGRWFLVFHAEGGEDNMLAMPEVRWQTRATAERTLRSMSVFELRRRLHILLERAMQEAGASPAEGARIHRERTSASAG
ncbi:MAG TPA: hypothetical protein VK929_01405 [Longimicrobiales bacterium]|nr:hypothetical protein [Longimicrobiales bacterium]